LLRVCRAPRPSRQQIIHHVLRVFGTSQCLGLDESQLLCLSLAGFKHSLLHNVTVAIRRFHAMVSRPSTEASLTRISGHGRHFSGCITQCGSLTTTTASLSLQSNTARRKRWSNEAGKAGICTTNPTHGRGCQCFPCVMRLHLANLVANRATIRLL
jgi:hypothetical protein